MITEETAKRIAYAYREIAVAEKLLDDVRKASDSFEEKDIRDVFGRRADCLQLGVPRGDTSRSLFDVPYSLAVPVIEAHIAHHRARLGALNQLAAGEIAGAAASI